MSQNQILQDAFSNEEIKLAETMLQLIDPQRSCTEVYWTTIGKALHNTHQGHESGLKTWIRHTESSINDSPVPNFMQVEGSIGETCTKLYQAFVDNTITIKTLAWYARKDSPTEYNEWHINWCMPSMQQSFSGSAEDIANAVSDEYWLDFVMKPKRNQWFQFKKHRWYQSDGCVGLKKLISSKFRDNYDDENIRRKLRMVSFKNRVIAEAQERFGNERISLDTNSKLIGVSNGVLEIIGDNIHFRHGIPEDYLSKSTNIPYRYDYSWNHPAVQECMEWLNQIFANDLSLLNKFMKFAASCLNREKNDKQVAIFTGDDSKLVMIKLFETIFGTDCVRFDISQFSKYQSSRPDLYQSARITFMDISEEESPNRMLEILFGQLNGKVSNPVLIYDDPVTSLNNDRVLVFPFAAAVDETYRPKSSIFASAFLWITVQHY